jgi:hypothetical protein
MPAAENSLYLPPERSRYCGLCLFYTLDHTSVFPLHIPKKYLLMLSREWENGMIATSYGLDHSPHSLRFAPERVSHSPTMFVGHSHYIPIKDTITLW